MIYDILSIKKSLIDSGWRRKKSSMSFYKSDCRIEQWYDNLFLHCGDFDLATTKDSHWYKIKNVPIDVFLDIVCGDPEKIRVKFENWYTAKILEELY